MNDGGPAFPHVYKPRPEFGKGVVETFTDGGMSLRDWFAGLALSQALSSSAEDGCYDYEAASFAAYRIADAMIAEKLRRNSSEISVPPGKE